MRWKERFSRRLPDRVFRQRTVLPDECSRGAQPAYLARAPGVGKRVTSPISPTSSAAMTVPQPEAVAGPLHPPHQDGVGTLGDAVQPVAQGFLRERVGKPGLVGAVVDAVEERVELVLEPRPFFDQPLPVERKLPDLLGFLGCWGYGVTGEPVNPPDHDFGYPSRIQGVVFLWVRCFPADVVHEHRSDRDDWQP